MNECLHSSIDIYRKKTPKSARIFEQSRRYHVNGVSHNIRFFSPYPFVTRSAKGRSITDVDGNRYTDYWMGHWSLILGHAAPPVSSLVRKQLPSCWMHGTVNEMTVMFSEVIQKAVPVAEKIRYVSTGTEATMYAVRTARAHTGRKVIAKVDGGWHGYTTDLLKSVNWPFEKSESLGLTDDAHIISIPYNDLEGSLKVLQEAKDDLAGVIMEPVLGGGGCIPASKEYLSGIEEFVHGNGSLLLLDEIVTGFRFSFGCLYPSMGLDPDIVTLGKIVGGGFPIGVICGRDEIMKISDTSMRPKSGRAYIGGGTFSANPVTMTAGRATLQHLRKNRGIYKKIGRLGDMARSGLERAFDGRVSVTGKGSLFLTHFLRDGVDRVESAADAARCDTELLRRYHFEMIARDGIFFLPGKLGAISGAHSEADIKALIGASERFSSLIRQ